MRLAPPEAGSGRLKSVVPIITGKREYGPTGEPDDMTPAGMRLEMQNTPA
jgi:hypothetical protein